ncbi:MAG: hypothetical protein U5R46_01660 [Gammaproteobacteria bacterium]|nr:hypothetical protein [Gammaproteobacteria bacterium]
MCVTEPAKGRIMHAALRIEDAFLYLADDFPEFCENGQSNSPKALGGSPVTIHRYVKDCDAAVKRTEQVGARVIRRPAPWPMAH